MTTAFYGPMPLGTWLPRPRSGREPRYDLKRLLDRVRLTPTDFAAAVGRSRAHVYRRVKDGVLWSEADDWAIHFGYLPWEVWPEWATANPEDWSPVTADDRLRARS